MTIQFSFIHVQRLSLSLAAVLIIGYTANPRYKTYEDCILAKVTANQTEAAVIAIRDACRVKFPLPPPTDEELGAAAEATANAAAATGDAPPADAAQAAADTAAAAADAAAALSNERR